MLGMINYQLSNSVPTVNWLTFNQVFFTIKCNFTAYSSYYCMSKKNGQRRRNLELNCLIKVRCHTRFQGAFTACGCVFKVITLVGSNQDTYFENATACSKRTLKTRKGWKFYQIPF